MVINNFYGPITDTLYIGRVFYFLAHLLRVALYEIRSLLLWIIRGAYVYTDFNYLRKSAFMRRTLPYRLSSNWDTLETRYTQH